MTDNQLSTIEKRIAADKQRVLDGLKKVPIVSVSCRKAGVGRSSFYRWKSEDKNFSTRVVKATTEGKQFINDLAESQLISAIKEQNMTGIIWWLRNNHPGYADRVELTHRTEGEELSSQQKKLVGKAIALTHHRESGGKNEKPDSD